MAVLGIVAEYNPFHNGHRYLIEQAVQKTNASAVVCVMSGHFTQRGEPALCSKWARAEMALKSGVDLVIELPFCFAARSAYYFARGALLTLSRSGVVSHLAFGSESGLIAPLDAVARILTAEPDSFRVLLKNNLDQGLSFAAARTQALKGIVNTPDLNIYEIEDLLRSPNNILAIEYLHVIHQEKLPLIPLSVQRLGSGYHSFELGDFASASAIRKAVQNQNISLQIYKAMPASAWDILEKEIALGHSPVRSDALEQLIFFRLRSSSKTELKQTYEVSEGLENRIKEASNLCTTLDELRHRIKSKRYSLTRINRALLYSLFLLSKSQVDLFDQVGPLYLHILGFSAKGQKILQEIKNKSPLKVLSRGSDVSEMVRKMSDPQGQMLALDVLASDVYSLLYPAPGSRFGGLDFTTPPIRMSD